MDIAASHAASSLFLNRVGRPDLAAITQRLGSGVSTWTKFHDLALVRLMTYAACTATHVLEGTLAPCDLADLVLLVFYDANWNGDPMSTTSVAGWWIELFPHPLQEPAIVLGLLATNVYWRTNRQSINCRIFARYPPGGDTDPDVTRRSIAAQVGYLG